MPFPYTLTSSNTIISNSSGVFIEELKMEERIPKVLQNDFWLEFVDAVEKEIALYVDYLSDIKETWYIDKMESDRLIEIGQTLNVPLDANVNNDTEFLREEVRAIPFKIKYKATATLYLSFLTAVEKNGTLFIYFYTGDNLVRDSEDLLQSIVGHTETESLFHESKLNFSGLTIQDILLDTGETLDDGWTLDTFLSQRNTCHTALEYYCNEVITKDGTDYLMTDDYLSYLFNSMYWGKKGSEVPHIGCQVSGIADSAGTYNTMDTGLKCATNGNYNPAVAVSFFKYIDFGTGASVSVPTALVNKIARTEILDEEKYEISDWYGLVAEYNGRQINDVDLSPAPNGVATSFSVTVPEIPVKEGSVRIVGTVSSVEYTLTDSGGVLTSDVATGTINYTTGAIAITSDIEFTETDNIGAFAESGYQECGLTEKTDGTETGLTSVTQYYFKVNIDGGGLTEYSITTAGVTTFSAVIALMNSAISGATFGIENGDLRCTSNSTGASSSIALAVGTTGTDLFGALTGYSSFDTAVDGTGSTFNYTVGAGKRTNTDGTFIFKYKINGITYLGSDDGAGNISGTGIDAGSSSIVYATGVITLVFSTDPDEGIDIDVTWTYDKTSYFDAGTDLKVEYLTENTIEITEAGVIDNNGDVVAYVTFPPVEFDSINYHMNMNFFLKRSGF